MSDTTNSSNDIYKPIKILRLKTDGDIHNETIFEGTKDYEELENKPAIEGNVLIGDMSLDQLGITAENMDITAESLGINAESLGITPEDLGMATAGAFKVASLFS